MCLIPTSGRHPNLTTRAHSYNDPTANGYTANHSLFSTAKEGWSRKASAVGNIKGTVSVRVRMGTVKQGQGSIVMIGVSLSQVIKHAIYMLIHGLQACIEGITGIDPHIGGNELHRTCYNTLQPSWCEWSNGYCVPLERTTLRGLTVYAPIAGKARQQPADERDAILDHFMTTRKNGERVFKPRQIDLAVVIDDKDFQCAEEWRDQMCELDGSQQASKVRKYLHIVFICITHTRAIGHQQ
jgi:hypothetical protein